MCQRDGADILRCERVLTVAEGGSYSERSIVRVERGGLVRDCCGKRGLPLDDGEVLESSTGIA